MRERETIVKIGLQTIIFKVVNTLCNSLSEKTQLNVQTWMIYVRFESRW